MTNPENDNRLPKSGRMQIVPGQPVSFIEDASGDAPRAPIEKRELATRIARSIRAYRDAAQGLLAGRFKELEAFAPEHLKHRGNTTVAVCTDGVVVRYDAPSEEAGKLRVGVVDHSLESFAPGISEYVIHLPSDPSTYDPGENGPTLMLGKFKVGSDQTQPIAAFRPVIIGSTRFPEGYIAPPPPHKPPVLLSTTNEIEFVMEGLVGPVEAGANPPVLTGATHSFVTRSKIRLRVGWQAIEIYPDVDPIYWNADHASMWAENDLLAAAAQRQFADSRYAALDPHVTARKTFLDLARQFDALLEGPEEPLHQFLKQHPQLLCPAHVKLWSKLPLGDRVTDFVFRLPTNDYLLVELESPLRQLFRKDGQQREELTHAFDQILDWRIYIENNLARLQTEFGLKGLSANPDSLIVIGRASTLSDENRRKIAVLQNQIPKLKILTYEDLLAHAKAVVENLFGPLGFEGQNTETYLVPVKS